MKGVGVVVIGRNEGERLRRCLESLDRSGASVVYVDSGSTDGSPELAAAHGAAVVSLDLRTPFTAARARNAGFERLEQLVPGLALVQFVDGDCEVAPGWLARAVSALRAEPSLAVACGRRRERHPDRSIYNRLCDLEWDTPVGPAQSCGGDAMVRADAFREVGGFDASLIAGEESDLCLRLRRRGWTIERLDAEMTLHDANILRFREWWRRAVRSGHAYAERWALHGRGPGRPWLRDNASILVSALILPALGLAAAPATSGVSLLAPLGLLSLQTVRSARERLRRGTPLRHATLWACSCAVAKFPLLQGQLTYLWSRLARRRTPLIEYKAQP